MKGSFKKGVVFLVALLFVSLGLCHFAKNMYGQDINRIINKEPIHGEIKLALEEDILIKESNKDDNFRYKFIGDLTVDSEGNILLLDSDRILKYDPRGKFIKSIGKKGQGPGEYLSPFKLFIDRQDNIYVNDQGHKLIIFGKEGKFKENILLKFSIPIESSNFHVDKEGNIYAFTREMSDSGLTKILIKSDKKGEIICRMKGAEEKNIKISGSKNGGVMGGLYHPYSSDSFFCNVQDSFLCFGENLKYQFILFDLAGNIRKIFANDEKPQSISYEEENKLGKSAVIPPHKPFFNKIISDEKGRIYVIRTKSIMNKSQMERIDVFNKDGQFLCRTELPSMPWAIKNGYIYIIEEDEEQMRIIKKLRMGPLSF